MVVNDDGSMTEAAAYFLQDMGMESEDFWVMFMPNGEIRWVPNSKVRCCGNWSLGRAKPEVTVAVKPPSPFVPPRPGD